LLKGVNELIFVLHALLADLGEIRFKQSAHHVIEHLRVSSKQTKEDRALLMDLNKITFTHVLYFESKERLGNTCVLRHEVTICILFNQALRAHNHLFDFQRSYT
jgi:hypothetical protein